VDKPNLISPGRVAEVPFYELPLERIADHPLPERDASKLLVYQDSGLTDSSFSNLSSFLPADSTLVLNNTMVIEARLFFQKTTGGVIEIFCLEPEGEMVKTMQSTRQTTWKCLIGGASKWKHGQVLEKRLLVNDKEVVLKARFTAKRDGYFVIEFNWNGGETFAEILHVAGTIPLPPYIKRKTIDSDKERYQTIFHEKPGSVAAPTASLHFTEKVFSELEKKGISRTYVTLNVGAGTFMPVKTEDLREHTMHAELFTITRTAINNILNSDLLIAAGTTTLRTLESLYWIGVKAADDKNARTLEQWDAYSLADDLTYRESLEMLLRIMDETGEEELNCSTKLLIMPGYRFKSAAALITNFHQPGSTLLALVAAFVGEDWKKIYDHALQNDYRFLSYGDSSLLWRC
jgi:S-adenosylmethionine:tRNA ribosyltransferase-isomerase